MTDFRTAAFRTIPFSVHVSPRDYPFPVLTAQQWLEMLGSHNWITAVIGVLGEGHHEQFLDAVAESVLCEAEVLAFARSALAQSAGRPWWEAERLINSCLDDGGRLLGTVLVSGADPSRMTLAVFLACVWATLTKGADATALVKLEAELLVPPPEATEAERAGLDDDGMSSMVDRLRGMPGVHIG